MKLFGSDEYISGGVVPESNFYSEQPNGRYGKKHSINSLNFLVTEEYLKPTGFENGEIITEIITKEYKVNSLLEAECLIRLLKQNVEIK